MCPFAVPANRYTQGVSGRDSIFLPTGKASWTSKRWKITFLREEQERAMMFLVLCRVKKVRSSTATQKNHIVPSWARTLTEKNKNNNSAGILSRLSNFPLTFSDNSMFAAPFGGTPDKIRPPVSRTGSQLPARSRYSRDSWVFFRSFDAGNQCVA